MNKFIKNNCNNNYYQSFFFSELMSNVSPYSLTLFLSTGYNLKIKCKTQTMTIDTILAKEHTNSIQSSQQLLVHNITALINISNNNIQLLRRISNLQKPCSNSSLL